MSKQNPNIANIPFVFVDVETTGYSPEKDRIIDIALIKVLNNQVVDTFTTLVNPENIYIPTYISYMTGIDNNLLEQSPKFYEIAKDVSDFLKHSVFVAHNVNFDYAFIKSELYRNNISFNSKRLCTVRLFKNIVPGKRRYGLDSLINFYDIPIDNRHTAISDAKVLVNFWEKLVNELGHENLEPTVVKLIKSPTKPPKVLQDDIEKLPNTPGVYIFKSSTGIPLYIGKSINIKQRVLNHFSNVTGNLDIKLIRETSKINYVETAGEFGALMLESKLIKKYLPLYNKRLRRVKKLIAVLAIEYFDTNSVVQFKELSLVNNNDVEKIIGVFKSIKEATNFVVQKCELNNICLKVVGLEKGTNACFNYQLGKCKGTCVGKEDIIHHNIRFIQAFTPIKVNSWPYKGAITIVEKNKKGLTEWHLVNKWKYLGKYTNESSIPEVSNLEVGFNYDEYKIIKKFLSNNKLSTKILIH